MKIDMVIILKMVKCKKIYKIECNINVIEREWCNDECRVCVVKFRCFMSEGGSEVGWVMEAPESRMCSPYLPSLRDGAKEARVHLALGADSQCAGGCVSLSLRKSEGDRSHGPGGKRLRKLAAARGISRQHVAPHWRRCLLGTQTRALVFATHALFFKATMLDGLPKQRRDAGISDIYVSIKNPKRRTKRTTKDYLSRPSPCAPCTLALFIVSPWLGALPTSDCAEFPRAANPRSSPDDSQLFPKGAAALRELYLNISSGEPSHSASQRNLKTVSKFFHSLSHLNYL